MFVSFAGWWEGAIDYAGTTSIDGRSIQTSPPSLAQEQQSVARDRIRRAAKELLVRRGFDVTVDEIATTCGVSTRTIFRHFGSHDRLIVETVKDIFDSWALRPSSPLPRPTDDLDGWLEGLAVLIHTRNAHVLGEAFWGVYATNGRDSPALLELIALRSEFRDRAVHYLASCAWLAAGGADKPPETLVLGFAINLSVFTTKSLMLDSQRTPTEIGVLTANLLKWLLKSSVSDTDAAFG